MVLLYICEMMGFTYLHGFKDGFWVVWSPVLCLTIITNAADPPMPTQEPQTENARVYAFGSELHMSMGISLIWHHIYGILY